MRVVRLFREAVLELRRQARFCKRMGDARANEAYLKAARHLDQIDRRLLAERRAARELEALEKKRKKPTYRTRLGMEREAF